MDEQQKITVEEVVSAYRAVGVAPIRGDFEFVTESRSFACAIGAILLCLDGELTADATSKSGEWTPYIAGFIDGFDGNDVGRRPPFPDKEEWSRGYEDGDAAYQHIYKVLGFVPTSDQIHDEVAEHDEEI